MVQRSLLVSSSLALALAIMPAYSQNEDDSLSLSDARQYMLALINKHRASQGAQPLVPDEAGAAAAETHSDEMATLGYHGQRDTLGRQATQRYTEFGGTGFNAESVSIAYVGMTPLPGGKAAALVKTDPQKFSKEILDGIESRFFNQKPPNDTLRLNLLDRAHNRLGIGLTAASGTGSGARIACCLEFINKYGKMEKIPRTLKLGDSLQVAGHLEKGVTLYCVDMRWDKSPTAMKVAELNNAPAVTYPSTRLLSVHPSSSGGKLKVTPDDDGSSFSMNIECQKEWQPGLYYVLVWGTSSVDAKPFVLSARTIAIN